jgi:hypothetical protein
MSPRIFIYFALIILFNIDCNSNPKGKCGNKNLFRDGLGIETNHSNAQDSFFIYLNNSNVLKAQGLLEDLTYIKTNTPEEIFYKKYRIAEIFKKESADALIAILINSFKPGNQDSSLCINELAETELKYLHIIGAFDSLKKARQYLEFKHFLDQYSNSFRLKWLWAEINFKLRDYSIAIPIYRELLKNHYYEVYSLRRIIKYYSEFKKDSSCYYSKMMSVKFPYEPNSGVLFCSDIDSVIFESEYKRCSMSYNKEDSIAAQVALGRYYLGKKLFSKCDSLYLLYTSSNTQFIPDTIKIWETGEFYDLHMRSLFLQQKFFLIYKFIISEMSYNNKIRVEDETEFKNLMLRYYKDYYNNGPDSNFQKFYSENFKWLSNSHEMDWSL